MLAPTAGDKNVLLQTAQAVGEGRVSRGVMELTSAPADATQTNTFSPQTAANYTTTTSVLG